MRLALGLGALVVLAIGAFLIIQSDDDGDAVVAPAIGAERAALALPTEAPAATDAARAPIETEAAPQPAAPPRPGPPEPAPPRWTTGTARIRVLDEDTGLPIEGAKARLAEFDGARETAQFDYVGTVVGESATDASGFAQIEGPAGEELVARVTVPHCPRFEFVTLAAGAITDVTFKTRVAAKLAVNVVDASDGKPIHMASLSFSTKQLSGASMQTSGMRTHADGICVIEGIDVIPGFEYSIGATASGYAPRHGIAVSLSQRESVSATIELERNGVRVHGALLRAEGIEEELVLRIVSRNEHEAGGDVQAEVAANGVFSTLVHRTGEWRLIVNGYCVDGGVERWFTIPDRATEHDCGFTRVARPDSFIEGRVALPDGSPAGPGQIRFGDMVAAIDADSTFSIPSCSLGPADLSIEWGTGAFADTMPRAQERVAAYTFTGLTGNVIQVMPRGVLIEFTRGGAPASIDHALTIEVQGNGIPGIKHHMGACGPQWRVQEMLGKAGVATVTVGVGGAQPVVRSITLNEGGLDGAEVRVEFTLEELGL
jgi:hypothetical protein